MASERVMVLLSKTALIILATLLLASQALASAWQECRYDVVIRETSDQNVTFRILGLAGQAGFAGGDPAACSHLSGTVVIKRREISQGGGELAAGDRLTATWSSYSAMGESGPVSGQSWAFE